MYSFLYLLTDETRTLLSGLRRDGMPVKGWEGIQAMGHSSGASGSLTQLRDRNNHIGPYQQAQGSKSFGACCSQQLIFRCVCQPCGNLLGQLQTRDRS